MIGRSLAMDLVQEFGTPLYVYDLDDIKARTSELQAVLPHHAKLFYSMKANPLPPVAAAARLAGTNIEISSEGELTAAIDAGFEPASMLYTGPAKGERELQRAAAQGVGCFSAESMRDLDRIALAAERESVTARVILRINPAPPISGNGAPPRVRLAMAGAASQFGFEEADVERLSARILAIGRVRVAGIHVYLGTQAADATALAEMFRIALDTAERLAAILPMRVAGLGGGFPWPFATTGAAPNLQPLGASLQTLAGMRKRSSDAELWFESGRYIVASSGTLLARVMDVKRSGGTTFYVLDAGISHLGGASGLGRVLRPTVSLVAIGRVSRGEPILADVVGPLCTPLDCLARAVSVPQVEPGEIVAIPNAGAYGATASLSNFLSRPAAAEVSLSCGRVVGAARLRGGHERLSTPQEAVNAKHLAVR